MSRNILFLLFLSCAVFLQAQDTAVPQKLTQKSFMSLDYLSVNMPAGEDNMGLTGIHYNLKINDWFYTGLGMYGSVNGFRGGLFTLGVDAGLKTNLGKALFLDTGIHLGGGGGSGAPDGGGAFILPHFNLGYQFSHFSLEAGYSYVNFFDKGAINSSQLNIALRVPLSFDYSLFTQAGKRLSRDVLNPSSWRKKAKKHGFIMRLDNFNLKGRTTDDNGNLIAGKTIRLAGFEFDSYFTEKSFTYIRADGAYRGIPAGFMDIVLGVGTGVSFNKNRTHVLAKFGLGAAGGGGVAIQGGFIINPELALEQKLFNNTALFINTGYFATPNGRFKAATYGIGLKYTTYQGGTLNVNEKPFKISKFKGVEINVGQEVYFNAKRDDGSEQDLYKILLQVNYYLNKTVYLAGQTSFANFGGAGAYAEGVFGLGLSTKSLSDTKLRFFAQFLAGGAGGGQINTGQGLIVKAGGGAVINISDKLGLRTTLGRVKATGSGLNSTYFNFGLSYRVAFLTVRD